jgi:thiamine-phosphate pyrophosphorylase
VIIPNLSPAVTRALDVAQRLAHSLNACEVQPVHLLQVLLEEEEGRAALLLAHAGLARADLKSVFPTPVPTASLQLPAQPMPLSSKMEEILYYAHEVAGDLSDDAMIAGDHVVLALLRRDESLRQELMARGLSWPRLESKVASAGVAALPLDEPLQLVEITEHLDAARILDANANRAREGLRVIEDYCRFSLEDRFLSSQVKQLRHDLAESLAGLPSGLLLEARETLTDVGTRLSTAQEQERHSLHAVVQANLKRLQEALRSLEEYGKLRDPALGRTLEQLRYRAYTLERAILLGTTARHRLADARLYVLVTGSLCSATLDWTIQEAAAGGAQIIQLREKALNDRELLERARKVRQWTRQAGVLFIMNDRPDLARLVEADGVHLGQEELPVKEARRIIGPDALIGVSTHNLEQVRQAVLDGASYIGVGPTFPSGTKPFTEFPGLEFVRQATAETSLPAFVIGGVNRQTLDAAVAAGARRAAVSQAICQADEPRQVAAELFRMLTTAAASDKSSR